MFKVSRSDVDRMLHATKHVERLLRNSGPKRARWFGRGSNISILLGTLDGTLSQGSSATMNVYDGDPLADSGDDITVYDWLLPSGESLAGATKVVAFRKSGKWYVIQYQWDPEPVEVSVITDIQHANGYIQVKTRTLYVTDAEDESGWTNVIQTTTCEGSGSG